MEGLGGGGDSLLLKVRSKMSGKLMDRGHSLNILISFQSRGSKGNTSRDKLGQRKSQTPFSSAFWVQKDFKYKNCWVQKNVSSDQS